jgi:type I restriction enzyme S subunit
VSRFLGITGVKEELSLSSKGSTMENLNAEILSKVSLVYPCTEEQQGILQYLNETEKKLERLLQRASDAVTLLNEHRTALISAAVTGKIDVRGWQKPNTEPQEAAEAASA